MTDTLDSQDSRGVVRRMLNEAKGPNFMIIRTAPNALTLRAYVSGYEVGHATLESADGVQGHLGNLFVKAEYRGQGYGKALAERVAGEARANGFRRIEADVTSQKSYRALVSAFGKPTEEAFESLSEVPATSYFDVGGEGKPSESWAVAWDL